MIAAVIWREFGVKVSRRSVGRSLRTVDPSPQRLMHRAHQQDPDVVNRWKNEEFPTIRAEAKRRVRSAIMAIIHAASANAFGVQRTRLDAAAHHCCATGISVRIVIRSMTSEDSQRGPASEPFCDEFAWAAATSSCAYGAGSADSPFPAP
jgi:hypothetical protein